MIETITEPILFLTSNEAFSSEMENALNQPNCISDGTQRGSTQPSRVTWGFQIILDIIRTMQGSERHVQIGSGLTLDKLLLFLFQNQLNRQEKKREEKNTFSQENLHRTFYVRFSFDKLSQHDTLYI